MWHSGYGDTPLGIYLSKNIHLLKSFPLNFQICNKAASVWWTCPYNNNQMEHFTWKRRKCNVMKKKTFSSIKYICHNTQLKILHKFMPMNISRPIITFTIQKNSRFWYFLGFFNFWTQNYDLWWYLCLLNTSVCCSFPNIGLG